MSQICSFHLQKDKGNLLVKKKRINDTDINICVYFISAIHIIEHVTPWNGALLLLS